MTMPRVPLLKQPDEGRTIGVVGDVYRFLATGEETNGKYAMWHATVPPGGGLPPHVHSREEEAFYILEGELALYLDEERHVVSPGMFANMPVGKTHSFKNETQQLVKMLITVAPAGLEKMFFEIGQPVEPGATSAPPPTQEMLAKLMAIAPAYGIEIKRPPQ